MLYNPVIVTYRMLHSTKTYDIVCDVVSTNGKNRLKTYDIVFFEDIVCDIVRPRYDTVRLTYDIAYYIERTMSYVRYHTKRNTH